MNNNQGNVTLWHGGVPDLRPGDLIKPGHQRAVVDGCPYCAARAAGGAYQGIDGPSQRHNRVYATSNRHERGVAYGRSTAGRGSG